MAVGVPAFSLSDLHEVLYLEMDLVACRRTAQQLNHRLTEEKESVPIKHEAAGLGGCLLW